MSLHLLTRYGLTREANGVSPPLEDQYGITHLPSTNDNNNANQFGWEFKVGGAGIVVHSLRVNLPSNSTDGTEMLRLWRVSDEELITSVEVTSESGAWVEGALSASVTLSANANYVVTTMRGVSSTRRIHFSSTSGFTFNTAIEFVQRRESSLEDFPSATVAGGIAGIPDIVFTA